MDTIKLPAISLIGLALKHKTSNTNGQAAIDCGNLWQEFQQGGYFDNIPGKITNEVLAVYHDYDGDYTQPYAYFIGCKIQPGTPVPAGLDSLTIPAAKYHQITTKGKMPDCVANAWANIWATDFPRAYQADFEVYGEKSRDWSNAEVEIYLSVR